jgi:hypothetical protein
MTLPSKIKNEYWVHATNPNPPNQWTDYSGKWLIFVPLKQLDEKWSLIANATAAGLLGIESKAATAKSNSLPSIARPTSSLDSLFQNDLKRFAFEVPFSLYLGSSI